MHGFEVGSRDEVKSNVGNLIIGSSVGNCINVHNLNFNRMSICLYSVFLCRELSCVE